METRLFSNGYVGIRLNSVSELMKYNALANFSICNEMENYFDEFVEEDDGTGKIIEREPTENEKLERILDAFKNGDSLYATFWLSCGEVVPNAATTLQSIFRVGQLVFFMKDNKICSKKIFRIMLNEMDDYGSCDDQTSILNKDTDEKIFLMREEENLYWLGDTKLYTSTVGKVCTKYMKIEVKKGSEIFPTKEKLIKHLMEEES